MALTAKEGHNILISNYKAHPASGLANSWATKFLLDIYSLKIF